MSTISDAIAKIAEGGEYEGINEEAVETESQPVENVDAEAQEGVVLNDDADAKAESKEAEAEEDEPQVQEDVDAEGYVPDFKYKVRDDEFEFDNKVKAVIKSKEDENYFRDLYTKAGGIDHYKEKVGELDTNFKTVNEENTLLKQGYEKLKELRDTKNIAEIGRVLGLSEDDFIDFVIEKAKEAELPAEERAAKEKHREYERKLAEINQKEESLKEHEQVRLQEMKIQAANQKISTLTSSDEGKVLSEALKENGLSITDEIARYGLAEHARTGKDPSVEDAYSFVANKYKFLVTNKQAKQPVLERKRTLPVVKGGATQVPIENAINSFDDLRRLANSF